MPSITRLQLYQLTKKPSIKPAQSVTTTCPLIKKLITMPMLNPINQLAMPFVSFFNHLPALLDCKDSRLQPILHQLPMPPAARPSYGLACRVRLVVVTANVTENAGHSGTSNVCPVMLPNTQSPNVLLTWKRIIPHFSQNVTRIVRVFMFSRLSLV